MNNDQRFKKGDRVRWTGAFDHTLAWASAVGTTGTVKNDTRNDSCTTNVQWDITDDVRVARGLGTGIYNGNLELISMSAFKTGDRVRYHKRHPRSGSPEHNGAVGTITDSTMPGHSHVDWDDRTPSRFIPGNPFDENLELITMIDTTKPLLVTSSIAPPRSVEFITETSEGHFLTGNPDGQPGWLIFDKQGQFVRSNDGRGSALVLANKIRTERSNITIGNITTPIEVLCEGTTVVTAKLTFVDGRMKNVDFVR